MAANEYPELAVTTSENLIIKIFQLWIWYTGWAK